MIPAHGIYGTGEWQAVFVRSEQFAIDQSGTYVSDGLYNLRDGNAYILLPIQNAIHLRGDHNRLNILAAITIGHAAGLTWMQCWKPLTIFMAYHTGWNSSVNYMV